MSLKTTILNAISSLIWKGLSLRYRIEVKGLEAITAKKNFTRPGGVLFLCNHPALIDPVISYSLLWPHFHPRPIATEYVYETAGISTLMQMMRGVPVPDFEASGSTLKRRRGEESFRKIKQGLKDGDCFIINPAGKLKSSGAEHIGGASWSSRLMREVPEANIVLMRIDGLWGSLFSRAATGKTPGLVSSFKRAFAVIFKNFIFFTPRRNITIEFALLEESAPRGQDRRATNTYLENWFNQYKRSEQGADGKKGIGESLSLVSYSCFKEELLEMRPGVIQDEIDSINVDQIPPAIQDEVKKELSRLSKRPFEKITPQMDLAKDLGLDSLDGAEIIIFLDDKYEVRGVRSNDLTTVAKVMALAAGQVDLAVPEDEDDVIDPLLKKWQERWKRPSAVPPEGRTVPEAFLRLCDRMGDAVACADRAWGVVTYRQLKMRVLLLSSEIQRMPGDRIGIMLPASTLVNTLILATLLAGKVPVMINWTVGSRHLKSCVENAGLHVILTSRKFTDILEGVDLDPIVSLLVMLEDIARGISLPTKLKAMLESYRKASAILDDRNAWYTDPHSPAVILFTSGTESLPKGVPLSHRNILSNHRAILAVVNLHDKDVMYGMLPPFHSFGFTVTGLLPLLIGLKVVFSPNPTDSIRLARGIDRWGITIMCSAPTFLKGILHAATPEQLKSVRLFVSGAEKAPQDLFEQVASLGDGKELLEGYGITECSPVLTINHPGKPVKGVGQPLSNVQIMIVHPESYEPLALGEMGLILARGPSIFSGYLDSSAKSPFIEIEGKSWYVTGDLGFVDDEGYLTISGRLKRFVKIGGEMISLSSIEVSLQKVFAAESVEGAGPSLAATAIEEAGQKTQLHLITTLDISLERANQILSESGLSNLARLSGVHKVPTIPVTGTGKVAYRELTALIPKQL